MTGHRYPANMQSHGPRRSLAEVEHGLRGEQIMLLLRQLEAETAGDDDIAEDCLRQIGDIEGKLRAIDAARGVTDGR